MNMPDPTSLVLVCLICEDWQIDAPPRARAAFGIQGLMVEIGQAAADHQRDDHPDTFDQPVAYKGAVLPPMASGRQATGGLYGTPLPRWWQWVTTVGVR